MTSSVDIFSAVKQKETLKAGNLKEGLTNKIIHLRQLWKKKIKIKHEVKEQKGNVAQTFLSDIKKKKFGGLFSPKNITFESFDSKQGFCKV